MKRESKRADSEQPVRSISGQLNGIHDGLKEIQCATGFLGMSFTGHQRHHSEDMLFGAQICFEMLDSRFEQLLGHIDSLASEVKQHATTA